MDPLDDVDDPLTALARDRLLARDKRDASAEFGCLATLAPDGQPSARMVTLRTIDAASVLISAHRSGPKVHQLAANPRFELVVYWPTLLRQYRLRGIAEWVPAANVPGLFAQAPWSSRVWDWLHEEWAQSTSVPDRQALIEKFYAMTHELEQRFGTRAAIGPSPAAGYLRLVPSRIEVVAIDPELRLHDRREYTKADHGWQFTSLVP